MGNTPHTRTHTVPTYLLFIVMGLTIWQWNARSHILHGQELKNLIHKSSTPPDIIAVQETWLTTTKTFTIKGYTPLHDPRTYSVGGGVSFLVKEGLSFEPIYYKDMEAIGLKVDDITIYNVYIPHAGRFVKEHPTLLPLHRFFQPNSVVLGDFNAHHPHWEGEKAKNTNALGTRLERLAFKT